MRSSSFLLIFLFTGSLVYTVADQFCPPKCVCQRKSIRCNNQSLTTIPKAPRDTRTLDLRFNKISELEPGTFRKLHHVRSLLLNDNRLTALRSGVFNGLGRLVYLYLYRNLITTIEPDAFQGMENLQQLYLQINNIHYISPETFTNLPNLERLYLHNNQLQNIPRRSFRNTPRLRKIRLDSNALICDCSMLWFAMTIWNRNITVSATCYNPAHTAGKSLSTMNIQDFHCNEPQIISSPKDAEVSIGEDVIFSCEVNGDPEPEKIWLRDSKPATLASHRYEILDNGDLMIHNADESDIGVIQCVANSPVGEAHSNPATMILKRQVSEESDKLAFVAIPKNQVAKLGQKHISFDCKVRGNPLPRTVWLYNDEILFLDEHIYLEHDGTLVIENVLESDVGNYTCQAESVVGKISASAELSILNPPTFTVVPNSEDVYIGDRVEFTCKARGTPVPVISWYRNTLDLVASDNIVFSNNNEILVILAASKDDDGLYHCRAENSEGLTEISAVLHVSELKIVIPHITLKPKNTEAFKETSIQLPCEGESVPPAVVEWRKNGARLLEDERITISKIGNLLMHNLTIEDSGSYECSIHNQYGRDTAALFLTVKDHILPGDEYVNIALTEAIRDVDQAIAQTVENLFNNKSSKGIHDIFRISRYPNAPARDIARAAEIYERALFKVQEFIQRGLKAKSTEPFDYHNVLSPKHLDIIARLSGCTAHREEKDCSDMCFNGKYRSIDGSCNNFKHPMWGSSLTGFRRILLPIYENGFSEPVGWNKGVKYNGFELPHARLISTEIISTVDITEDIKITHMTMQWGQWVDHDLDHSLPSVSSQTWDGVDCKKTCDYAAPCFPIDVPRNDLRIPNRRCIDFIRTSSVCGSGVTSVLFGKLQPREQINQLTSYMDASQVYGFEKEVAVDLRDFTNENGMLRVGAIFPGKKPLLPTTGINAMDCRRSLLKEESTRPCFVSGDIRANEQIGLAAMHTIFMREHNRIALTLKTINSFWSSDKIYEEARKIVGAQMQFITYKHWLPHILGPAGMIELGEYKGYDQDVNPSVSNVFATAALRFGHSMINPILHRYDENFEPISHGHLMLRHAFFAPWKLTDEGGVDPLIRGMFTTPAKLKTPTQNLNSELTERLFETSHAVALDLAAINIQRGRDHAIPPYTKWRQFCNMSEVNTFDDLANEITNEDVRKKLKDIYGTPLNIDVWVGGILEDQVEGGKVGPLFRCLLLEQFKRLRDGDRFWYENPSVFKPKQLEEIKETSLARVLCDNGDNIDTISENVFLLPELQDGLVDCADIPGIDLKFWADCESCDEVSGRQKRETEHGRFNKLESSHRNLQKIVDDLSNSVSQLKTYCENN